MSNSSDLCNDINKEQFTLCEKLYRKYLVNYYSPLFDLYRYEEAYPQDNILTPNEGDSDVEISIEEKSSNEYDYSHHDVLPALLDKIYKSQVSFVFRSIFTYSLAIAKGEKALNLLENILNFKTEYLVTRSNDEEEFSIKLSVFGKAIMRKAFAKISDRAKQISNIIKGFKMIKRLLFYREKQKVTKFWFKWKLFNTNFYEHSQTISDMDSVVINESKRRIISSSRCASKDLDQSRKACERMMPPKYGKRTTIKNRRVKKMTKCMSQISKNIICKSNFDNFIKNHQINDRDLVLTNSTVKSCVNDKHSKDFDEQIENSNAEIEEGQIMIVDDSMFQNSIDKNDNNITVIENKPLKITNNNISNVNNISQLSNASNQFATNQNTSYNSTKSLTSSEKK